MKAIICLIFLLSIGYSASAKETTYMGSTPAHHDVRTFLGISLTDSIDFIRWKTIFRNDQYELHCQYGISEPSTSGFINERQVDFSGGFKKENNYYYLSHGGKTFFLLIINGNILHLLDANKKLLVGTGGYSYTLNNTQPIKTDQFNPPASRQEPGKSFVFEGRTPCQELSALFGLNKSAACDKMKWYIILYTDSVTGQPSYYLSGGMNYRKETMAKGEWRIVRGKDNRIIYQLRPPGQAYTIYLIKVDDNILYFTDPGGNLLVGNEDFSYALNRRAINR